MDRPVPNSPATGAVIFDLFGTLVPKWSGPRSRASVREMARVLEMPEDSLRLEFVATFNERQIGLHSSFGESLTEICKTLRYVPPPGAIARAAAIRTELHRQVMEPRPDAIPTLQTLRQMGYAIGLISNAGPTAPLVWAELPVAAYVDVSLFSATEGVAKPNPDIYLRASDRLGVRPEACLYVGDGTSGELPGAREVGMRPILLDIEEEVRAEPNSSDPAWDGERIRAINDVLGIVR